MSVSKITADSFEASVLKSDRPVMVDFWASWCNPCNMLAPIVEEVSGDFENKLDFKKLNIDEAGEIAAQYGVTSIPTLVIFDKGREKKRMIGLSTKEEIESFINHNV